MCASWEGRSCIQWVVEKRIPRQCGKIATAKREGRVGRLCYWFQASRRFLALLAVLPMFRLCVCVLEIADSDIAIASS